MIIRLRSFKTKKVQQKKELVSNDDDVPWFQAAMLGLSIGSTLLGARGQSRASKAKMRQNRIAIEQINQSLESLEETASAQSESVRTEMDDKIMDSGAKTKNMWEDVLKAQDNAIATQDFAVSGEVEDNRFRMQERMDEQFEMNVGNLRQNLDKQLAKIEGWREGETRRLNAEKRKLQAGISAASETSTTWKALGFS